MILGLCVWSGKWCHRAEQWAVPIPPRAAQPAMLLVLLVYFKGSRCHENL